MNVLRPFRAGLNTLKGAALRAFGVFGFCVALTGCHSLNPREAFIGPGFQPQNIYRSANSLPADLRRVAVLPLTADERYATLTDARETLDPLIAAELLKTRKFEVKRLTVDEVKTTTGESAWTGEEALPENFFSMLNKAYGCDAVLFCQLTTFKGYAPLAIGWRMKLVDARSRQILWAGDEVFDAGQSAVKNGARRYQLEQVHSSEGGDWVMENSPFYFGQYTLATLLDTLPAR